MEQVATAPVAGQPSWDDLRIFIHCASSMSFRRAAILLRLSSSTVVRRIERLERAVGARLFDRLPDGVILTPEGHAILREARKMEEAAFGILRSKDQLPRHRGPVTVSITEGLGSYWVMPQLVQFQRQYPMIIVQLQCAMTNADVLRHEADIAVQLVKPVNPDLVSLRLGRLHIYPFASRNYLDTYGTPREVHDLVHHRIIKQVAPNLDSQVWAREIGIDDIDQIVGIATNASTAILYAVENGAGIGALPTYVSALNDKIVPIDVGRWHQMDIWLTYHPDIRRTERKAFMIEWIKKIFDPHRHPWFGDEFVHPKEFRGSLRA